MHIGVVFPQTEIGNDPGAIKEYAQAVERMGYTHILAYDHVIESFRNALFEGYKTGEGIEPDLLAQFAPAERATAALGIVVWPMVEFEADDALFYELHLKLRTASRVLRVIKEVPAKSPAMLYSQARRIRWHELFEPHGFMVESLGADADSGGMPPKQVITQVREGIRDAFAHHSGATPVVDPDEPRVVVVAHLRHGRCMLSLDTSGKSLHKRGYRQPGHPAPLKETLAAAILLLAGYDGTQPFLDPMCGSGTLAIEAAMMAVNKAPQIHRKKGEFYFEWLKDFDRELWRTTQDRVRAEKLGFDAVGDQAFVRHALESD